MNCPDGYRVEEIKSGNLLFDIAQKEWGDGNLWKEVILNRENGQPFSEEESRRLQKGQLVCVKIKLKLVSNKLTYFKSNVDINVAGISDPNTIKGLEEQQVIYKVIPNSEFYLREYPSKIKRHWYIDLLEPRNGKYKWYAFEDDFSKP